MWTRWTVLEVRAGERTSEAWKGWERHFAKRNLKLDLGVRSQQPGTAGGGGGGFFAWPTPNTTPESQKIGTLSKTASKTGSFPKGAHRSYKGAQPVFQTNSRKGGRQTPPLRKKPLIQLYWLVGATQRRSRARFPGARWQFPGPRPSHSSRG